MDRLVVVGDTEDFDEFVRTHARSLFGTAHLLCGDADAAEELVQDTLVRLLPKWPAVSAAANPVAYVRRAVVHRFVDGRRSPAARVLPTDDLPERADVADIAADTVTRESVRQLLATLPERQRAAVILKYLYDWPDADVAAAIGCRIASVRSMTRRALIALRETAVAPDDRPIAVPARKESDR